MHPSKLPRWRGAAPLQRTLFHGDQVSAVTIMQMDAGMDTGPILRQEERLVRPGVTLPEFSQEMANAGAEL